MHRDLQKIKKASGNKILETLSTIQYMTICCLCHANVNYAFCNVIGALKFESGSVPSDKNVTTLDLFYTHMWRFGHTTSPKCVLCCSWSLHLNSVLNLHLRHSCRFAYSVCVKLLHRQTSLMLRHLSWFLSNYQYSACSFCSGNTKQPVMCT